MSLPIAEGARRKRPKFHEFADQDRNAVFCSGIEGCSAGDGESPPSGSPFHQMARSIRRDFLRFSELLRERLGEKRQGPVLPAPGTGNLGGFANGIFGGVCAVRQEGILETPAISDRRCPLCDGICFPREALERGALPREGHSFPRGAQGDPLRRLSSLLL